MSKSLKNFTTIKQMLEHFTAKQIRFTFLLHQWNTTMNYSPENSLPEAISKEEQFNNFFKNIKAILRQCNLEKTEQKWNEKDRQLEALLLAKQEAVREALCDSFNTPQAIQELFELMTLTNSYISQSPSLIKIPLVRQVSKFVFHIMKCFGIYEDGDFPAVVGTGESGSASYEDTITPLMNVLLKFRDQVKQNAGSGGSDIFSLCDKLRDEVLPYLGIQLEDKGKDEDSIWKYEDKEVLIKKCEDKIKEKAKKDEEKRAKAELVLKQKSTSGKDWFSVFEAGTYSKFDAETGLPSHWLKANKDKVMEEVPVSEAILNKLKKTQNKQ